MRARLRDGERTQPPSRRSTGGSDIELLALMARAPETGDTNGQDDRANHGLGRAGMDGVRSLRDETGKPECRDSAGTRSGRISPTSSAIGT